MWRKSVLQYSPVLNMFSFVAAADAISRQTGDLAIKFKVRSHYFPARPHLLFQSRNITTLREVPNYTVGLYGKVYR